MPKKTFFNLEKKKREKFINTFLREFSIHTFDDASITSVVKSLGIAKGSVYQYFDNKIDLFLFLIKQCSTVKAKYIGHLKRENYKDFWEFFRDLHVKGVEFDLENPLQSHFLHNLPNNLNSPSIKELYNNFLVQTVIWFEKNVEYEVAKGNFRDDVPIKTMGFFLYKTSLSISEQMVLFSDLNPEKSIKQNLPVYLNKVDILMQKVDDYIAIMKKALNKKVE